MLNERLVFKLNNIKGGSLLWLKLLQKTSVRYLYVYKEGNVETKSTSTCSVIKVYRVFGRNVRKSELK